MNIRERIKKEIEVQKKIEGAQCDDELLLKYLGAVTTQNQWDALIKCKHRRYGKLSYETYRFYYPTKELLNFVEIMKR